MQRRTLLRRTAALGAVGLAGCMDAAGGDSDPPDDGNGGGAEPTTGSPTASPTPGVSVTDAQIETMNTECDSGSSGEASIRFDETAGTVAVGGTIWASNPCHEARIQSTELDGSTLSIRIGVVRPDPDAVCVDCVGAVEYDAVVRMAGALPGEVVVYHSHDEEETEVARTTHC